MTTHQHHSKNEIVELIEKSNYIVVLTGAGISTPSGIPDFRSSNYGLWQKNDPMKVASLTAFRKKPEEFYGWIKPLIVKILFAKPNAGHISLAKMERIGLVKAIITQNIDRLHQKAGSKNVLELHGSLEQMICLNCGEMYRSTLFVRPFLEKNILPICKKCMDILKPNIVLYENLLPTDSWIEAQSLCEKADLLLVVGSSLEVSPVNQLPLVTLKSGGRFAIINFSTTHFDHFAQLVIHENTAKILPQVLRTISLRRHKLISGFPSFQIASLEDRPRDES